MDFKELSKKEQKLVAANKYNLFRDQCIKIQEKGIDACVDDKDFDLKGVKITEDARDLIALAVPQIFDYKGLTFDRPLEGLGVGGFYYFMSLFYFERRRQLATRLESYTMDSMLMRHSITGDEMWLVNKVDEIPDEEIDKYKSELD